MAVEKQLTINVPAEKAFSYLVDFPRHSEWASHDLKIEQTSEGPVGQGATFKSVGHQFGRANEDTITVTEYVPNERIVFECDGDAGKTRHTFRFSAADGGVQVTKAFEAVQPKFPFSLLLPVLSMFVLPGAMAKDLGRIKDRLEGSAA